MRSTFAIAARDVRSFFSSPIAYVVLTVWMLACGQQFHEYCKYFASTPSTSAEENPIALFYGGTILFYILVLIFVPLMTMRAFAEERSTGTEEALFTTPVGVGSLVFGKYLATMVFWLALWLPTLMYVWIASRFGYADLGATASVLFGILLLGMNWSALGLLASAIAPNQIIAYTLGFMMTVSLFAFGIFSGNNSDIQEIREYMSAYEHISTFSRGIIDSRYISFNLITAGFAIFLTTRVIHGRRYR